MAIDPLTGLETNTQPATPASVIDNTSLSKTAQDIANQQGVQAAQVANTTTNEAQSAPLASYDAAKTKSTIDNTVNYKSGTSYVDSALSTVSGQLDKLLSSDNPYIKLNESKAQEQSAGRGLLNTTLAAQAGRTAAIGAALPIAQQDAQTYATAQGKQQAAEYNAEQIQVESIASGQMVEQKAALDRQTQALNEAFQSRMAGMDEQNKTMYADVQNNYNVALQNLNQINNKILQDQQLTAQQATNVTTAASNIMQNYQISVENMLKDPDLLALGPAAMNNAVNQLQNLAGNSIKFIGKSQGIDMDAYVNQYLTPLTPR